jgi:FKBP-type peptidyl-prolyl cis-trans isomerase SlyD
VAKFQRARTRIKIFSGKTEEFCILTLESGTLILADWTAKVKDTGQLIDTTRKSDAESAGQADPTRTYEPRLIAVGEGWVLKGLDEALAGADPGQKLDVELPPEKAFGARDITKISRIPIRKFGEKASELTVGAEVEVDNRIGIVRSLESGRATVDFNPKYAGKTLLYNVEIKERLDSNGAKIAALIRRRLAIDKEKLKFESTDDEIKITIPSDYFLTEGIQIIKRAISTDLFKFIKPLQRVSFVETFENPSKKIEEAPHQEKGESASSAGQAQNVPEIPSEKSSSDANERREEAPKPKEEGLKSKKMTPRKPASNQAKKGKQSKG